MDFREITNIEYINQGDFACPGCAAGLSMRHALKVLGDETVIVMPASCWSIIAGGLPTTALQVPLMHVPFATAAAVASGAKNAFREKGEPDKNVVCWAGDGGTFDIGLQAISGAAERKEDIIYVCYDNEAYMNTGIQRSSATPPGAWTTTTPAGNPLIFEKKDMFNIIASHNPAYVATTTIAFPDDFYKKFEKAKNAKGFRFLHLLSACPPGWRIDSEDSVKAMRLAVETGIFVMMEKEGEQEVKVTYKPEEFKPVKEYFKLQGRYKHLDEKTIDIIQGRINKRLKKLNLI